MRNVRVGPEQDDGAGRAGRVGEVLLADEHEGAFRQLAPRRGGLGGDDLFRGAVEMQGAGSPAVVVGPGHVAVDGELDLVHGRSVLVARQAAAHPPGQPFADDAYDGVRCGVQHDDVRRLAEWVLVFQISGRQAGLAAAPIADLWRHAALAYDASVRGDWRAATNTLVAARALLAGDRPCRRAPSRAAVLKDSLTGPGRAVESREVRGSAQAAIDVARSVRDLRLRYQSPDAVDAARLDRWLAQMPLDADDQDTNAVRGDCFGIDYLRDRIRAGLNEPTTTRLDTELESPPAAINEDDLAAVPKVAHRLRTTLGQILA